MTMKQKIKLIILLFWGVLAVARSQPYVEIEITPSVEKSGDVIVNITKLKQTDYNRLILLTLPMELTPCLPISNDVPQKFNGCWYIDRKNNKTQLCIGNILQAGYTELHMQITLPNMMRNSDNLSHSYKLNICTNYSDGLHRFLSLTHNDSTEIVFASKIIFKGNKKYPVLKVEPDNEWAKTDENERIYIIPPENQEANTYLIFGVPNVADIAKFIFTTACAFIVSMLSGLNVYKYPKETRKTVYAILGFIIILAITTVSFYLLFGNLESNGNIALEYIAPVLGYFIGIVIAVGTDKKKNG